jgi:hypothetical protein
MPRSTHPRLAGRRSATRATRRPARATRWRSLTALFGAAPSWSSSAASDSPSVWAGLPGLLHLIESIVRDLPRTHLAATSHHRVAALARRRYHLVQHVLGAAPISPSSRFRTPLPSGAALPVDRSVRRRSPSPRATGHSRRCMRAAWGARALVPRTGSRAVLWSLGSHSIESARGRHHSQNTIELAIPILLWQLTGVRAREAGALIALTAIAS